MPADGPSTSATSKLSSRSSREVAEHFGAIDVVIAGAGVLGPLQTIGPTAPADWDRVIDINLNGVWRTLKAAAPHVQATGGHLVAVSSMIAYIHPPLLASYAASKAGVAAMTDVVRLEMRAVGVTVGSVHPVIFRTPMIGDALSSPAAVELVKDFTGAFKTVELDTVVDEIVRGIERRAKRTVVPRQHGPTALIPGLAQAAIERLLFRPRTVARAIQLGSEPTDHSTDRRGLMSTYTDTTKAPSPTYCPRRAPLDVLKRDGRTILRRRRGA